MLINTFYTNHAHYICKSGILALIYICIAPILALIALQMYTHKFRSDSTFSRLS